MTFAATIDYTPDKTKIAEIRPSHRDYQEGLRQQGKLVIAGPFTDDSGGLIVYNAATKEDAEAIIRNDPFFKHGIFVSWTIREWRIIKANFDLLPKE
jgi:uncharacterized protein YciI